MTRSAFARRCASAGRGSKDARPRSGRPANAPAASPATSRAMSAAARSSPPPAAASRSARCSGSVASAASVSRAAAALHATRCAWARGGGASRPSASGQERDDVARPGQQHDGRAGGQLQVVAQQQAAGGAGQRDQRGHAGQAPDLVPRSAPRWPAASSGPPPSACPVAWKPATRLSTTRPRKTKCSVRSAPPTERRKPGSTLDQQRR